jgi:hypothetical protein
MEAAASEIAPADESRTARFAAEKIYDAASREPCTRLYFCR